MIAKVGVGEDKSVLMAKAKSPSDPMPANGQTATSSSSIAKDAESSSMPPPAMPSSASTRTAASAARASNNKEDVSKVDHVFKPSLLVNLKEKPSFCSKKPF